MKTLQQCKDEVSHKYGHETWNSLMDPIIANKVMTAYTLYHNEAYELYASQFKREWIPVTDRLPEEGSIVELCYKVGDKYYHCLGLNVGYHKIEVGEDDDTLIDDSWYDDLTPGLYELIDCSAIRCDYDSYYIKRNAVYWKYLTPLPEPPKP